jgi:hypothetical protein
MLARQARSDSDLQRRAQAAQVFVQLDNHRPGETDVGPGIVARVKNSSKQPIYDLAVELPSGTEALPHLMPDSEQAFPGLGTNAAASTRGCSFRDAAGLRWHTSGSGVSSEVADADVRLESASAI